MNAYFDRLMAHIPGGYTKDALEAPALTLSGSGYVSIQGDRLYVSSGNQAATIDLHGQSVQSIVSQLPSGVTAKVLQNGMAELLLLPQQATWAQLPVTLNLPTNGLWFIVGAMARNLEARRRSRQSQVAQINLAAATGNLLNWWGATAGVERLPGEPDLYYAQRIMALKFRENVNNIAIQKFFKVLGYQANVDDTTPGQFNVTVQMPLAKPSSYVADSSYFVSAVNQIKAAGTIATVILQYSLSDAASVTDAISAFSVTPGTGQLWGSGLRWGQGHWYPPTQYAPPSSITTKAHEFTSASDSITVNIGSPPYRWGSNIKWGQGTRSH